MARQDANSGKKRKSGAAGLRLKSKKSGLPHSSSSPTLPGVGPGQQETVRGVGGKRVKRKVQRLLQYTQAPASRSEGEALQPMEIAQRVVRRGALHPADQRRAALRRRREARRTGAETGTYHALLSTAQERLEAVKADIALYEQAANSEVFQDDPFAAISQHLSEHMEVLKPQTPDVGRIPLE